MPVTWSLRSKRCTGDAQRLVARVARLALVRISVAAPAQLAQPPRVEIDIDRAAVAGHVDPVEEGLRLPADEHELRDAPGAPPPEAVTVNDLQPNARDRPSLIARHWHELCKRRAACYLLPAGKPTNETLLALRSYCTRRRTSPASSESTGRSAERA